jgi:hypothetical protein
MGVTIHYKGRIKTTSLIEPLVEELVEICTTNKWKYNLLNADQSEDSKIPSLKGIYFNPPECDTMSMCFDPDGRLISFIAYVVASKCNEKLNEYAFYSSCKTQFGGPDVHIKIVNLLKYISGKYFDEWEVIDEAEYYATGDREVLEKKLGFINKIIDALDDAFSAHGDKLEGKDTKEINSFIQDVFKGEKPNP